jgi:hypothetical protein
LTQIFSAKEGEDVVKELLNFDGQKYKAKMKKIAIQRKISSKKYSNGYHYYS